MRHALGFTVLAAFAMSLSAVAQAPILRLSVSPQPVQVAAGRTAQARLIAENTSVYEADEIEIDWVGPTSLAFLEPPAVIQVIPPFSAKAVIFSLGAASDAEEGAYVVAVDVIYTYCIDELCYQIVEPLEFSVSVAGIVVASDDGVTVNGSESTAPTASETAEFPWAWAGVAGGVFLVLGVLISWRTANRKWPLYVVLVLVCAGSLIHGVARRQHEQAQVIGAVLCTSCVGIEQAPLNERPLSSGTIAAIQAIETEIELVVFSAEWCHACPYAEAVVRAITEHNERISYRDVDVADDPTLARQRGVTRSGRTVVPAVLRVDTEEIIFGVTDLERRLVALLGDGS
jgi:glutaredoxin